ncbi:MAG: chemotaxis protein CheD [Verrucomicrobiota bacterium]
MSEIIVGVGDLQVSNRADSIITTFALGSCIGVTLWDPARKVGGMLHAMLPDSKIHGKSTEKRAMFVDTGMQDFFQKLREMGASPEHCECKLFGGAQVMQADNFFKIGARNVAAYLQIAEQNGIRILCNETGGQFNRTIKIRLSDGLVAVKTPNQEVFTR